MNPLPFDADSQAWIRHAARAADWFSAQLDPSGRLDESRHDLGAYYKWPLFLSALGRSDLARTIFQVIVDDFMTPAGDFRTSAEKSADPLYGQIADSYTNTWPIVAARVFDRPDIGRPALECLLQRHVPATGGFLTGPTGAHSEERQDIVTIAGCGNAFLAWDELEPARSAGDTLIHVLDLQDTIPARFYLYIDGQGRLLPELDLPEQLIFIQLDKPEQRYVYLGMAAVFLARLFLVSGEERFLDGARRYFAINQACGPAVYQGTGCCKTGWAAAVLARITGREEYVQSVHRASAAVMAEQGEEGTWTAPGRSAMLCCDATGELGYHLVQYCLELAARKIS